MIGKFFILFACVAFGGAALMKREAPTSAPSPYDDFLKNVLDFGKTFQESAKSLSESENTVAVQKQLKDGSDTLLAQLGALSTSLKSAFEDATGKAKEALETTRATVDKTAEDLRKAHPEVEQNVSELKEKIQQAVQKTVQESQKLVTEVQANIAQTNEKLAPKLQAAYSDFIKQAQDVQKKVHEAANANKQ